MAKPRSHKFEGRLRSPQISSRLTGQGLRPDNPAKYGGILKPEARSQKGTTQFVPSQAALSRTLMASCFRLLASYENKILVARRITV
jgi:hypothetical protein